jgi:hypothetical protein
MSQTATLFLGAVVAIGAASALIFLAYDHELGRLAMAHSAGFQASIRCSSSNRRTS